MVDPRKTDHLIKIDPEMHALWQYARHPSRPGYIKLRRHARHLWPSDDEISLLTLDTFPQLYPLGTLVRKSFYDETSNRGSLSWALLLPTMVFMDGTPLVTPKMVDVGCGGADPCRDIGNPYRAFVDLLTLVPLASLA